VAFGPDAMALSHRLVTNKSYMISKAAIKESAKQYRAWPGNEMNIDFDLTLTEHSTIVECKTIELNKTSEHEQETNEAAAKPVLHEKFTALNKLVEKPKDASVDVLGVIDEIQPMKRAANNLSLLNFTIVDQSKVPVNVAMWGKQAESFQLSVGTILVLNSVRISNFGGLTLSVFRDSGYLEMPASYGLENVELLRKWWQDIWHMSDIRAHAYKSLRDREESIRASYKRRSLEDHEDGNNSTKSRRSH
jgi:replication factor A1